MIKRLLSRFIFAQNKYIFHSGGQTGKVTALSRQREYRIAGSRPVRCAKYILNYFQTSLVLECHFAIMSV
tara:strand:- start:375 stop:584 length:210 start_codon:yes stop_codon:yes gene_type:complete